MDQIKNKIQTQIEKLKLEILEITNQIETIRLEGDETDVGITTELQLKMEVISDKVAMLQKNLASYNLSIDKNKVCLGKTIRISNNQVKDKQITLVFPEDADSQGGYISFESPLGQALLDKKEGEVISFKTPGGDQEFKVSKIL